MPASPALAPSCFSVLGSLGSLTSFCALWSVDRLQKALWIFGLMCPCEAHTSCRSEGHLSSAERRLLENASQNSFLGKATSSTHTCCPIPRPWPPSQALDTQAFYCLSLVRPGRGGKPAAECEDHSSCDQVPSGNTYWCAPMAD